MALWDRVTQLFAIPPVEEPPEFRVSSAFVAAEGSLADLVARINGVSVGAWRPVSVKDALGVPSIQRAVSLIASTTGMLSVQGFRDGVLMNEPPRLLARPDPYDTPYGFYAGSAASMAKHGEIVWWISRVDNDGIAQALQRVPLDELTVDENQRNRLLPTYKWGDKEGTRYSGANPTGRFVHIKYPLSEPFDLRGEGPLQLGKVAVSVSVESQIWAANFYGKGGKARDIIKHAGQLDPTLRDAMGLPDPDGMSEADRLKAQYELRDNNTPMVIDQMIESITHPAVDMGSAQMLEARLHQNGDAARLFGLPGKFVEYVQSGTSLTYSTLETAFTDLVKTCLQPLYLEPMEQALSDLLTRSTVARFNVKGFLRADIKTRFEVHKTAIETGIYGPDYAQREEGIAPGDVEFAPVPFSPPQAIPAPIETRSDGPVRCPKCAKARFTVESVEPLRLRCINCKETTAQGPYVRSEPSEIRPTIEVHAHFPPDFVRNDIPITVNSPDVKVEPTFNAPEPSPVNVALATNMDLPLAGIAAATERLRSGLEEEANQRRSDAEALTAQLAALSESQGELARSINAPRRKTISATRNEVGQLTDAVLIDEPAA